jgi:hypothetical protein
MRQGNFVIKKIFPDSMPVRKTKPSVFPLNYLCEHHGTEKISLCIFAKIIDDDTKN